MINQGQLALLQTGVAGWNKWRREEPEAKINLEKAYLGYFELGEANLVGADLRGADLASANLTRANLLGANLAGTDLNLTNLLGANLNRADLTEAYLSEANLLGAHLIKANLSRANLSRAHLSGTNFSEANLNEANLDKASLTNANLREANLHNASLRQTTIGYTIFGINDLSHTNDLETVEHISPSIISTSTLQLSKGKISETFLRGCGFTDWEIESSKLYNPDLANEEIVKIQHRIYNSRATQATQISPLFISYSHADTIFIDKLEKYLNEKGIRFWRDIHDLTSGKIETQIERAIRQHPTVLLVLSKNSINSDWVQHEVRKARELEKSIGTDVLCPISLDDTWKTSNWPQRIMEQVMEYNILDFSAWEDNFTFQSKFTKLLSGLDLFYKKPTE